MKHATGISLSESERSVLEKLRRGQKVPVRLAQRAAIVLLAAEGLENQQIAAELAALPPLALRWTKLSVNKWLKDVYNQVFDASIAFEHVTTASRDHREAAQAFLEKRPPKFKRS